MKKALLLCSTHNDLGLINALKKLEYYIIVTGNISDLPGQKYCDEFIKADYSDKELILEIAKNKNVDAIIQCCNDFGVYTASYVAEKLGLPGYDDYETTLILHNKDKFKAFAKVNQIISPISNSFSDEVSAYKFCNNSNYPLIIKPTDCSAGNGIKKVDNDIEAKRAINIAFEKSRAKKIVIEPFIDGKQHGFCTFLINQKVVAVSSNDEYSFLNPYRVEIDTFPAIQTEQTRQILVEQIEKIASILKLKDGIFHLQYIEDENGPHIIEVMRRILGNMYSVPANRLNGFDWDYWETRARCGLSLDDFPKNHPSDGYFAYKTILATANGVIDSINILSKYDKYLVDSFLLKKSGDRVERFESEPIGFLFFRFSSMEEMHKILISEYENNMVNMRG